jgi:hypothetical protein
MKHMLYTIVLPLPLASHIGIIIYENVPAQQRQFHPDQTFDATSLPLFLYTFKLGEHPLSFRKIVY